MWRRHAIVVDSAGDGPSGGADGVCAVWRERMRTISASGREQRAWRRLLAPFNTEIRIRRGLSYGANSRFAGARGMGPIIASAQTRNDAAVQVYELMRAEITRIGRERRRRPNLRRARRC